MLAMSDLTEFQLTTLALIGEKSEHGLGVKDRLEQYYNTEVNHGRLYPNLDELVEQDLVTKSQHDKRTNWYEITTEGEAVLSKRLDLLERAFNVEHVRTEAEE
jgi:DNA-binding PadR family transcriptional regulator